MVKRIEMYYLPLMVFFFVVFVLSMIQLKVEIPMLLLERFFNNGGWLEIFVIGLYGGFLAYKMQDVHNSGKWRRISWSLFSLWFFAQLLLGIFISDIFLLTGKLHLPVPAMLISGPLYRGEKSVMTILFLSTIVLTGPAWCSQFCYFGAIDNLMATGKTKRSLINHKYRIKHTLLFLIITITLFLRLFSVDRLTATLLGALFGVLGVAVIVFYSRKQKRMLHCTVFCPIGTMVNYMKVINPFRIQIDSKCDNCMACSILCKFDALRLEDIRNRIPGRTCTLCGDCLSSCKGSFIKYRFLKLSPQKSRSFYLFMTISVYTIFLAMGRL